MGKMAEQISELGNVITSLSEVQADATVPKNVRSKLDLIIETLRQDIEMPIKINKTLNYLDEIASDANLNSYTRTQLWNVMSMLEKL